MHSHYTQFAYVKQEERWRRVTSRQTTRRRSVWAPLLSRNPLRRSQIDGPAVRHCQEAAPVGFAFRTVRRHKHSRPIHARLLWHFIETTAQAYCYDIAVGNIEFAWDWRKARSNIARHGVSFEEAQTVFLDENARLIDDPDHSFRARCLIVSHYYRGADSVIRLISARPATPKEQKLYWSFR